MRKSSILVVEDEAVVALDLKMQLEDLGYDVVGIADNSVQALELARRHRPDLTLMDIKLKGNIDGIETAGTMRLELNLPVIFLTSFSDSQTVRRAAETAPYGYLTKPFQIKELTAGVEVALYKSSMERREHHADRWFASTLRCVTDGVVMTLLDQTVRFINPAAEALTGWALTEAIGRPIDEVVCILAPTDLLRPRGHEAPIPPVAFGQTLEISRSLSLRQRDGTEVFVDEWTGPITDDDGQRLGTVVVLRNATPRRTQEAKLQASEERFRSAFDFAPMGMALVALDGRFLLVNDALCQLLGRAGTDVQDHYNNDFTALADVAHEAERLRELLSGRAPSVQFEKRYLQPHGDDLGVLVIASVLREDDEPTCYLYQVHDLTLQKKAAQQVAELATERLRRQASEATNQSTREFLSRVGHEMRTPLNAVLGYGQLLQLETLRGNAQLQGYADQIVSAGNHLLSMVSEVLEVKGVDVGVWGVRMQRVSLAQSVREVTQLMLPAAQAQQVSLSGEVPTGVFVHADPTRLRQVLLNLASNAVKYSRPGGSVRWCIEVAPQGRARLSVTDDGMGMSPEQIEKLFQPYERLGQENSAVPGTGLGLVITRGLVEQMRGTIALTSELGKGTRVLLEFEIG